MIFPPRLVCPLAALLLASPGPATAASPESRSTMSEWKGGQMWTFSAQHFPPPKQAAERHGPTRPVSFTLHALVSGGERVDGTDCWKVEVIPGKGAPERYSERHRVWVDKATGWPIKAIRVKDGGSVEVRRVGDGSVVAEFPPRMPIAFFPQPEKSRLSMSSGATAFTLQKTIDGTNVVVEGTLTDGKAERVRVRQAWVADERWWRDCELYVNGKKDCSVKLLSAPPGHQEVKPASVPLGRQDQVCHEWERLYRRLTDQNSDQPAALRTMGDDSGRK